MLIGLVPFAIGFGIRTIPRFRQRNQSMGDRLKFGGPPSLSLPLGVAVGFAVFPLAAWWMGQPLAVIVAFIALFVLIIVRRVTSEVRDVVLQSSGKKSMLLNLVLFDRSKI
jgi:hypothetical protein